MAEDGLSVCQRPPPSPRYFCVFISSSCKGTSQTGLGPTHKTSFHLNHLFKDPVSKYRHISRYWELRLQGMNVVGCKSAYNTEEGSGALLSETARSREPEHLRREDAGSLFDCASQTVPEDGCPRPCTLPHFVSSGDPGHVSDNSLSSISLDHQASGCLWFWPSSSGRMCLQPPPHPPAPRVIALGSASFLQARDNLPCSF